MSLLDRKSCNPQETWSSAKSDTLHSTSRKAPVDSNRHLPLQQEIQCYLESKLFFFIVIFHNLKSCDSAILVDFRTPRSVVFRERIPFYEAAA